MADYKVTFCARCNLYGVLRKYANLYLCDDCIKYGEKIASKFKIGGVDLEVELYNNEWK